MKKVIEIKKKTIVLPNPNPNPNPNPTTIHDLSIHRQKKIQFLRQKIDYLSDLQLSILESEIYQKIRNEYPDLHDKSSVFHDLYHHLIQRMFVNLDPNAYLKNTYLKEQILNSKIQIEKLPYLSNQELYPEKWKEYTKREEIELHHQIHGEAFVATTLFTCRRCKKNQCKYFQRQIRSCDEGMTNFITCMNCNNHWRQNN